MLKRYHKRKSFITIMFKIKKSKFRSEKKIVRKKNKTQTVRLLFVKQILIER